MTRMSRHHGLHREDDGAIDWNSLLPTLCRELEYENAGWTNQEWLDLQKGSDKKRCQYVLAACGLIIYLRAIQGHSAGTIVDPVILDNAELAYGWSEHLYHVGCSRLMHSILQSGLPARGRDAKEGRQPVFFTALDPMSNDPDEMICRDHERYNTKSIWRIIQDANYWINLKKAQYKGLKFCQTRSHAIVLHDSVPADCIENVVVFFVCVASNIITFSRACAVSHVA